MSQVHCPICYGELEVRQVEPCYVCGAWGGVPSKEIHEFTIRETKQDLTLCHLCWLEEVLSDQGDLKKSIGIASEDDLCVAHERVHPELDKYCPKCRRRLALLKLMVASATDQ